VRTALLRRSFSFTPPDRAAWWLGLSVTGALALAALGLWVGWKYLGFVMVAFGFVHPRRRDSDDRSSGSERGKTRGVRVSYRPVGSVLVGDDGLRVTRGRRTTFVSWSRVEAVDADPRDSGVLRVRRRGWPLVLRVGEAGPATLDACKRALRSYHGRGAPTIPAALDHVGSRERLRCAAALLAQDVYRRAIPTVEQLLEVAQSPRAPRHARVAAIAALAVGAPDLRRTLEAIHARMADPDLANEVARALKGPA
jgi:hypothetical protein